MKQFEVDFGTNFKGADYNMKMFYKCNSVEDIECCKQAIVDYLNVQIHLIENANSDVKGNKV